MVNFKTIKGKFKDWVYKKISEWYINLANKRSYNLKPLTDGYDYRINPHFEGCNVCVYNPIEVVYFALKTIHNNISLLSIQGVNVDYSDEELIKVTISTLHPGFLIGLYGRDINKLTEILSRYFGRKTIVDIKEIKGVYFTFRVY